MVLSLDRIYGQYLERLLTDRPQPTEFLAEFPELDAEQAEVLRAQLQPLFPNGRADEIPYRQLGDFRLLRRLGEGGMGMVFLAEQLSLRRPVALKIIRPELLGSASVAERFRREAEAVARLRHPNIVTIYAAGESGAVRYLAMELLPGRGLDSILEEAARRGELLPLEQVLTWGADLADALRCAHDAGIVHRDVKPSNIRITPDGRVLLLDFGLAAEGGSVTFSQSNYFQGSPSYAAPEQVQWVRSTIDPRTDVYGLGLTLYECLSGATPFRGETAEQLFLQILRREPEPLRRVNTALPKDVETVVHKAMHKEPARRYASAAALHADVLALRDHRPIQARPASLLERCVLWARRRPSKAAAFLLAALLFVGGPLAYALIERQARSDVQDALALANDRFLESEGHRLVLLAREVLAKDPGLSLLLALEASERHESTLARVAMMQALQDLHEVRTFVGHEAPLGSIHTVGDAEIVVTAGGDGFVIVWDRVSGAIRHRLPCSDLAYFAQLTPDGSRVLGAGRDGLVRVWSSESGELLRELDLGEASTRGAMHPTRPLLAASSYGGSVWLIDPDADGEAAVRPLGKHGKNVWGVQFTPDGNRMISSSWDGTARVWRVADGALEAELDHPTAVYGVDVTPDGRELATACMDGTVRRWSLEDFTLVGEHASPGNALLDVEYVRGGRVVVGALTGSQIAGWRCSDGEQVFRDSLLFGSSRLEESADGRYLLVALQDSTRLYNTANWKMSAVLRGHGGSLRDVRFLEDGEHVLTASADGTARLWQIHPERPGQVLLETMRAPQISEALPDGRILIGNSYGETFVLDAEEAEPVPLEGVESPVMSFTRDPTNRWLAGACYDHLKSGTGQVVVWDAVTLEPRLRRSVGWIVSAAPVFLPDGEAVLGVDRRRTPRLWAVPSGEEVFALEGHEDAVRALAVDPRGRFLASGGEDLTVRIWDQRTGAALEVIREGSKAARNHLAFDADGERLATACDDGVVCVWSVPEWELLWQKRLHEDDPVFLAFHGEDSLLTASMDGLARRVDAGTGEEIVTYRGHEAAIHSAALSPDGRRLATASQDATLRIWDVESGVNELFLQPCLGLRSAARFSDDGQHVLFVTPEGRTYRWRLEDFTAEARRRKPRGFTDEERRRFQLDREAPVESRTP